MTNTIQLSTCGQTAVAYYKVYSGTDSEEPGDVVQEIYACAAHSAEVIRRIGLGIFTAYSVEPGEGYHCGDNPDA